MRYLLVLLLAGCASGNTCIEQSQKIGDSIMNADSGKYGVVTRIYGESSKCPYLTKPVLADVKYR